MIKLALLLACAAGAASAAPAPKAAAAKEAKRPMEWKGQYGGPAAPGHRLVEDAKGWTALWRELGKDAPALDLKTHAAVAVFLGERPTGGWTAAFEEKAEGPDVVVAYVIQAPKGFVTQAFTQPYVVRAVARPAKGKVRVREGGRR